MARFTVVDSKSETIASVSTSPEMKEKEPLEMEEKAWKIIRDESESQENEKRRLDSDTIQTKGGKNGSDVVNGKEDSVILDETDLVAAILQEADNLVEEMADDTCEIDEMGNPVDEVCADESALSRVKSKLKKVVRRTLGLVRTGGSSEDLSDDVSLSSSSSSSSLSSSVYLDSFQIVNLDDESVPEGELLERGWEKRGNSSALRRNAEVWKFALSCVFKALKPKKLRKKGASEEEIQQAKIDAAVFIRNGLLKLGPSFVKLVSIQYPPYFDYACMCDCHLMLATLACKSTQYCS